MSDYTFACRQVFNVWGAPGIPSTFRATLYRDDRIVQRRDFSWSIHRAEKQCERWSRLYGAVPR